MKPASTFFVLSLLFAFSDRGTLRAAADDAAGLAFFESKIRPVLAKHCYECHSAESGKSNFKSRTAGPDENGGPIWL